MEARGKVFKFGDNIDTDIIIPARYLTDYDPEILKEHCMEPVAPELYKEVEPGDIMVGGKNFGCGSSREHAPAAIRATGFSCVIAESFARIFYRNSINIGLPIFECPEAAKEIKQGDRVKVDFDTGEIFDETTGKRFQGQPLPPFIQNIVNHGGLMNAIAAEQGGNR